MSTTKALVLMSALVLGVDAFIVYGLDAIGGAISHLVAARIFGV